MSIERRRIMGRPKTENKFIRKDITMEPEQYRALSDYSDRIDRPLSWVIRKAVAEYLKNVVI